MKTGQESVVLAMDRGNGDVKLITSTLEKAGFQVWTSSETSSVISLCNSQTSVRLVIVDTTATGIHPVGLADRLLQSNPRIRVLLLSDEEDDSDRLHTPNVYGKLSRPFRRAQLLGSVLDATAPELYHTA